MRDYTCYLSLGANLGERGETLREAMRRLARLEKTRLVEVSPFYETAPWGKLDQPAFINAVATVETSLAPMELLHGCQSIERALGRVRHEHWGARTIDIDLLHIPGVFFAEPELVLPHPYLTQRAFVLRPLADIAPELVIQGRPVREWCQLTGDQEVSPAAELSDPWPFCMIACLDAKRGIGYRNELLVHLPEDMKRFRALTEGHVVIMGRRTMESLPGRKPLPHRQNVVLSRELDRAEGFSVCHSLLELWQVLGRLHADVPQRRFWCIGGAKLYEELLPYAHEACLTRLKAAYTADRFFPELEAFSLVDADDRGHYVFERYEAADRMLENRKKLLGDGNISQ